MPRKIKPGSIYKHFKGKLYKVLYIAKDCETLKDVVVYEALYNDHQIWIRDLENFISLVDKEKYPEVTAKYRFEEIK